MKISACAIGVLLVFGFGVGVGEDARAAVRLDATQAVVLGGASLPPGRGVASAPEGVSGSSATRAFDGLTHTTWQATIKEGQPCWLEFRFDDDVCWIATEYTVSNGVSGAERDPSEWELQGSLNGAEWVTLDTKKRESFPGRRWTRTFRLRNKVAYNRYRLVFAVVGNPSLIEVSEVAFTAKAPVLPPKEVSVQAERGSTVVSWQAAEAATGYAVRRAAERSGPYVLVASGVLGTQLVDKGPFEDSELSYYTVASELSPVQGVISAPASVPTPVAPPTGLGVTLGKGQVVLAWTPSAKAVAYVVRRSLIKEGPYEVIGSQLTAPIYTDTGLSTGTAYHYVVCGVANGKEGVDSAPVSAVFPPDAPTGLVAEPGKEMVTLKWNPVALATSYRILRANAENAPKVEVAVVTDVTTFVDTAVSHKETYRYTVAAANDCGMSAESEPVSAVPIRPPGFWRR